VVKFLIFTTATFLVACTHPAPLSEYTTARTALEAARRAEAVRYAPTDFHRAEGSYRKGEFFFKEKEYDRARQAFILTQRYAEKAENKARLDPKK